MGYQEIDNSRRDPDIQDTTAGDMHHSIKTLGLEHLSLSLSPSAWSDEEMLGGTIEGEGGNALGIIGKGQRYYMVHVGCI